MKKFLIAVLTVMTALFIWTQAAQAAPNDPPPGNGPPELCDIMPWLPQCDGGGDSITIDDPTEEECPNGGIVVVFNETRYPICNGANGEDGSNGSDGSNGTDGTDGSNGVDGANGADGAPGAPGAAGVNTIVDQTDECVATRTGHLRISKKRGDRIRKLTALFHGEKLKIVRKGKRQWTADVPLAGLPKGVWAVHIRYYRNGKLRRQVHLYRTCHGINTHREGLNARPVVRL